MCLAVLSFIADFYTVYQIVANAVIFDFWTSRWIIAILLAALLTVGGFAFLAIGGSSGSLDSALIIFAALYVICSLIVYLFWAFRVTVQQVTPQDFFGFFVLFGILIWAGAGIMYHKEKEALIFPAFGYAAGSLAFVVLLVNRYVGQEVPFEFWSFFEQMIVLIIGIVLFIGLFTKFEWALD